jgi:hypothetical protein
MEACGVPTLFTSWPRSKRKRKRYSPTIPLKSITLPGVVAHVFNPSTREAEAGRFLSSRPAWNYKVSSRTARVRNPVLKNQKKKKGITL